MISTDISINQSINQSSFISSPLLIQRGIAINNKQYKWTGSHICCSNRVCDQFRYI